MQLRGSNCNNIRSKLLSRSSLRPLPVMGRAIAHRQAHQTDDALKDFESATKSSPEWRTPRWVTALLPLSAGQSVAEMDTEWQERQVAHH
jgi:hypothetical protein